jgi:uncharacterized iron-regulated membrane protein
MLKLREGSRITFVYTNAHAKDLIIAGLIEANGTYHPHSYDVKTGAIREFNDGKNSTVNNFIIRLHANLLAGLNGALFISAIGIVFVLSAITGLIIYAPFMKKVMFGLVRFGSGKRRTFSDLHKLVGVTSLGFNILIAVTGSTITLGNLGFRQWSVVELQKHIAALPPRPAVMPALPPIDLVFASAAKAQPQASIQSIIFPGGVQSDRYYLCYQHGGGMLSRHLRAMTVVGVESPHTGEALAVPLWVQFVVLSTPLHFGNFAGIGIKIAYSLFGLTAGILAVTGASLSIISWVKRWRKRRRSGRMTSASFMPAQESTD